MNDPTFYVVWNPAHGLPRFKHDTHGAAESEARRLAGEHPGESFFVLQALSRAQRVDPVTVTRLDDIPF